MFIYYISIVIAFQILLAFRAKNPDFKTTVLITYLWPIAFPFIVFILITDAIGWECDINKSDKYIGFRTPNDNWPGFAITLFKYELLTWKRR